MAWASSFLHLPHQTPLNTTGTLTAKLQYRANIDA